MSGGVFQLGSLPEVAEDNPLKGTYDGYREVGDLPINQNFNIEFDLNVVSGTNKKDILIGTRLRDELIGGDNNDYLIAGLGNDYVSGGNGDDILNGTRRLAMGIGEIDVLEGGNGKDTFVLGKWNQAYYIGEGDLDYALIQDYNSKDTIWLGSDEFTLDSENYTFGGQTGTAILVDNDLVAFLVDVTPDMITI